MRTGLLPLALALALAACGPQEMGERGEIVVAMAGSRVVIGSDDSVAEAPTVPGMARPASLRVVPGAFARARAVILAEGPQARLAAKPGPEVCLDYGLDKITISPPLPDFDVLVADCPDPAVLSLAQAVLAAVDP